MSRPSIAALCSLGLLAQEPIEMGPLPTRDMFPLFMVSQVYQPVAPLPIGEGRWEWTLDAMRANTFEFSEILKDRVPRDPEGRAVVTRAYVEAHAAEYADIPIIFFFDEEISRGELRARRGLTPNTDVWFQLPIQSHYGGWMDNLIEGFHKLGFKQFGRDLVARGQLTLVVMEYGQIRFFSQERLKAQVQDPTFGVVHRFATGPTWTLSAAFSLKPPVKTTYDHYRSGWDPALHLTARWQPHSAHVFYGGMGAVLRTKGSAAYEELEGNGFRHLFGLHAGWEGRWGVKARPFFQLVWQSGQLDRQPYQMLDRPSLQHDLGFHWQIRRNAVLSFRYLNNITHNANTADMGLGISLRIRSGDTRRTQGERR